MADANKGNFAHAHKCYTYTHVDAMTFACVHRKMQAEMEGKGGRHEGGREEGKEREGEYWGQEKSAVEVPTDNNAEMQHE